MSVTAVAAIGAAAIGAYSSKRASDKAASSAQKGLDQSSGLYQQSRDSAIKLYDSAQQAGNKGLTSAFNYYKEAAPSRYQPMIKANTAAQGVIGQGAQQANNAILGLPVDMSFTQAQQVNPDLSFISGASLPQSGMLGIGDTLTEQPGTGGEVAPTEKGKMDTRTSIRTAGGLMMDPLSKERYDPVERLKNPLGLSSGVQNKLESKSVGKKILKKLF